MVDYNPGPHHENGLTQAELAEKAGISQKTISCYESGSTYPKNRNIYKTLADILSEDVNYLRNEDDEFITSDRQQELEKLDLRHQLEFEKIKVYGQKYLKNND